MLQNQKVATAKNFKRMYLFNAMYQALISNTIKRVASFPTHHIICELRKKNQNFKQIQNHNSQKIEYILEQGYELKKSESLIMQP